MDWRGWSAVVVLAALLLAPLATPFEAGAAPFAPGVGAGGGWAVAAEAEGSRRADENE